MLFLLLSKIPFPLAPSHPFKPYKTKLLKSLPNFVVHQSHNTDLLKKKKHNKAKQYKNRFLISIYSLPEAKYWSGVPRHTDLHQAFLVYLMQECEVWLYFKYVLLPSYSPTSTSKYLKYTSLFSYPWPVVFLFMDSFVPLPLLKKMS